MPNVCRWEVERHLSCVVTEADTSLERPAKFSRGESSSRKLQRSIGRFHNATLEERLEMLTHAEESLDNLLAETELEGDAICRLVRKCVGWLHPQVVRAGTINLGNEGPVESEGHLQYRVRHLLITALRSLDLTDATTYQAVETAVAHITHMMKDPVELKSTRVAKQWQQLRILIGAPPTPENGDPVKDQAVGERDQANSVLESEGPHPRLPGHLPENKVQQHRQRPPSHDWAGSFENAYFPSKKVKQLEFVFSSTEAVQLECPKCQKRMTSNWYWQHPKTKEVHVLVPCNGHKACKGKTGKKIFWKATDGRQTVVDDFNHLDLCQHHRRRTKCEHCRGKMICWPKAMEPLCRVQKFREKKAHELENWAWCIIVFGFGCWWVWHIIVIICHPWRSPSAISDHLMTCHPHWSLLITTWMTCCQHQQTKLLQQLHLFSSCSNRIGFWMEKTLDRRPGRVASGHGGCWRLARLGGSVDVSVRCVKILKV